MKRALLLVAVAACDRRAPISSCEDDLHGVWITPDDHRWMLLDNGATLEGYPLFDDSVPDGAPRVIDLHRGERFTGEVKRRFMKGATQCDAHAPIRIAKCKEDRLQLVISDVPTPLSMTPCQWPQPAEARFEHWRRE